MLHIISECLKHVLCGANIPDTGLNIGGKVWRKNEEEEKEKEKEKEEKWRGGRVKMEGGRKGKGKKN